MNSGADLTAKFIQFKQMAVSLRTFRLLLGVLLCLSSITVAQTTLTVTVDNKAINAMATYNYTIVFSSTVSRTNLTLFFPTEVSLSAVTILTLNSTIALNSSTNTSAFKVSPGNNSIWLNRTVGYRLVVVVAGVKNPSAAVQATYFSIRSNDTADTVNINFANFIEYTPGTLDSCNYLFTGTTEQTNCTLNASVVLANPLSVGNNSILIGYPNPWENSKSKYLTYNSTITCSFVAGSQSGSGNCAIQTSQIQFNFTSAIVLNAGTVFIALIGGVNCPPTVTTQSSASYNVLTQDSKGFNVDSRSSCTIANTLVTTASGVFNNLAVPINSAYNNINISFPAQIISFESNDILDIVYEVTMACDIITVNRGSNYLSWPFVTSPSTGICTYSASFSSNNNYISNIVIYLSAIMTAPPSAQPTTIYFLFKRNLSPFMNLTAVFSAIAQPLLNTSFSLQLDSNSAVVSASYLFTLTLGQPIGAWGQVILYLPLNINTNNLTNSSCSASIGSSSLSLYSCTTIHSSTNNIIVFSFAQSSSIPKGSILSLNVRGLGNSRVVFTTYSFGVETYYNRSLSLSRVEYNLLAAETSFTTYRSLSMSISPGTFFVYDNLNTTLYYKNEVILPSGVVFTFIFPSAILDLIFNPVLVYANTTLLAVNETNVVTVSGFKQMIFRVNQQIPIGTNISVIFTLKTPANLGTYSYINLTIIKEGNTYEQCVGTLQLAVTKASAVDFTFTPTGSTIAMSTGAVTTYRFTMTTYIPHPSTFFLLISLPSDTSYIYNNSGQISTCSGSCSSTVRTPNGTLLNITMNNPNSSLKSFTFTLGFFVNPRSLGRGMLWNFSTFNVTGPQIGSGSAAVEITLASVLNASLARNRRYYRNNTDPIELYVTLANKLIIGDFMLLQFGSDSYTAHSATLTCTKAIGCSATNQTTTNILVVKYDPSANELGLTQLTILIDGLISSAITGYNEYKYFNISTYTASKLLIDQGYATYNISCGEVASSRCKQCMGNGSCLSCYSDFNSRLFAGRCVNNCSTESYFQNYNANGTCELCGGGCATCISSLSCITCVTAVNLQYYLYPQNQTCVPSCDLGANYFSQKINSITYCKKCYSLLCLVCKDDGISSCTKCADGVVLEGGQCMSSCTLPNTFLSAGVCTSCPAACRGCTANSVANCLICEYPYLNDSKICVLNCHTGSVANYSTQTCGCGVKCRTCEGDINYCLTCANSSQVAFQGLCQGSTCPNYSYNSNGTCIRCTPGCFTCPGGICTVCDNTTYSFESKCYTDCNTVGQQYENDVNTMKCVLCPNGCDRCDGLTCLSCLSSYSLLDKTCISDCMVLGNCKPEVPDKVLPMPGTLAVVVWVALVVIVKLLLNKLYAPYSLMLGVCLAEFGLVLASLAVVGQSDGISRLLLGTDYSYRLSIRNLLLVGLLFNYICNILYLIVFYKYIRPMISAPRQIDYIAHGAVLIVGTLTNYRFALIAFSRMFPKPHIPVDNSSRITPINYLAVSSVLLDLITLAASGLLVYKEYPGTNLFMLGIDLLVVLVLVAAITVWMVAVPKSEDYYLPDVRKFSMEDNYRTEEDINHEKSQSYAKLVSASYHQDASLPEIPLNQEPYEHPIDQKTLILMASSEEDNPPLPAIAKSVNPKVDQVRLSQSSAIEEADIDIDEVIHFEKDRGGEERKEDKQPKEGQNSAGEEKNSTKVAMDEAKTKRISSTTLNPVKKGSPSKGQQQLLQRKNREQAKNFSKERVRKLQPLSQGNSDLILVRSTQQEAPSRRVANDTPVNLLRGKHRPRRSEQQMSVNKLPAKQSKVFETQKSEQSHTDEVDLQAIIDSKIKQSQAFDRGLKIERRKDPTEDISPSWFNMQNQRVDIAQIQQIE